MKRSYSIHCLFLSNVGGVKMTSFMSFRTKKMRIMGEKEGDLTQSYDKTP